MTLAAEQRLHTAQPSLSRQIRDLEYEVDVQLFSRSVHGVELTAAGKAFLDHARFALAQVDAAVEAAHRAAQPARKTFALGFLTGQEMNWLPRAMQVLRDELPNIEVTISSDYSPDLAEALVARQARRGLPARRAGVRSGLSGGIPRAADRPDAERSSAHQLRSDPPAGTRRRDLHRWLEQGCGAARRDRALSPPLRARRQTGSWRGQHGDGHVSRCVHPWVGAMPEYANNLLPWSVVSRPLEGEAPTIDLAVGHSKSNTSPILKLDLSRLRTAGAHARNKMNA